MESGTVTTGRTLTIFLPAGEDLTVVVAAGGSGTVTLLGANAGDADQSKTSVAAGTTTIFGPYADGQRFKIACAAISIAFTADRVDPPTQAAIDQISVASDVGTAETGSTAVEEQVAGLHKTTLTVNTTLPAIAGGANLAVGKLLYTFPAGEIIVESAYMSLGITQTQGNINADTPDGGLGTTIGSGVVAVLGGTAAFENIITGQTFNNCTGTPEVKSSIPTAGVPLVIATADNHTVYFNVADGWAASGDAAALLAGTVVLNWRFMT